MAHVFKDVECMFGELDEVLLVVKRGKFLFYVQREAR